MPCKHPGAALPLGTETRAWKAPTSVQEESSTPQRYDFFFFLCVFLSDYLIFKGSYYIWKLLSAGLCGFWAAGFAGFIFYFLQRHEVIWLVVAESWRGTLEEIKSPKIFKFLPNINPQSLLKSWDGGNLFPSSAAPSSGSPKTHQGSVLPAALTALNSAPLGPTSPFLIFFPL